MRALKPARCAGDLRRLACVLAHPQHAVDLSALLDQESLGMHVAVHDTRRLAARPVPQRRSRRAPRRQVIASRLTTSPSTSPPRATRTCFARAPFRSPSFYLYHAVRRDVADDPHPRADNR